MDGMRAENQAFFEAMRLFNGLFFPEALTASAA
jgi:hypothetical protein